MRKRLFIGIITISAIALYGCGNTSTNTVADNTTNTVADNTTNTVADSSGDNNVVADSKPEEQQSVKINKGETVTMTNGSYELEYTLKDVVFEKEVYSKSDNQFAEYFPDIDDESYIVAKLELKNVGGDTVSYNFFDDIQVTFDNKYNYRMQQLDLESSVMSQFWSCQPLKTVEVYWVQSVPDEVKDKGVNISFTVGDTLYKY